MAIATKNNATLNSNHYYFLLVDNGTSGKYGGEILLRKRFERFLLKQTITHTCKFRFLFSGKNKRIFVFICFKLNIQIFLLYALLLKAEQIQFEWF